MILIMDFAPCLPAHYAIFGTPVTHTPLASGQATTANALHSQPGTTVINGELLAVDHALRYPSTSFPPVRKGDTFTIAAATYVARENAQPP